MTAFRATPFSPPIFCVQLFLERISSPWEPNFEGIQSLDVHFLPSNAASIQTVPQGQLRPNSGRVFFVRARKEQLSHLDGLMGCLELRSNGSGIFGSLSGKLEMNRVEMNTPMALTCHLSASQSTSSASPPLTAHLLLSVSQVGRMHSGEVKQAAAVDADMQTDGPRMAEHSCQTASLKMASGRRSRRALLRVLLFLLLRARREGDGVGRKAPLRQHQATMTRLSFPPNSAHILRQLSARNLAHAEQLRARIGYLSAVHRTLVPRANGHEMPSKDGRKVRKSSEMVKKKEAALKLNLKPTEMPSRPRLVKIPLARESLEKLLPKTFSHEQTRISPSSPSSGLQSMPSSASSARALDEPIAVNRGDEKLESALRRPPAQFPTTTSRVGNNGTEQRVEALSRQSAASSSSRASSASRFLTPKAASIASRRSSSGNSGASTSASSTAKSRGGRSSSASKQSGTSAASSSRQKTSSSTASSSASSESSGKSGSKRASSAASESGGFSSVRTDSSVPMEIPGSSSKDSTKCFWRN